MMSQARFEEAAVTAERPVILAEKGRRPELTQRFLETSLPLVYAGLRYAERDPIGTDATLNAANAEGLRAFYRRWYRPSRATIVMVGDADPDMLEALVRARFGEWRGEGPEPQEPDDGRPAEVAQPIAALAYPGVPVTATATWIRPYEPIPHTIARERLFLEEMLGAADHQPPPRSACARRLRLRDRRGQPVAPAPHRQHHLLVDQRARGALARGDAGGLRDHRRRRRLAAQRRRDRARDPQSAHRRKRRAAR